MPNSERLMRLSVHFNIFAAMKEDQTRCFLDIHCLIKIITTISSVFVVKEILKKTQHNFLFKGKLNNPKLVISRIF